jgi:hypothetical protein
LKTITLNQEMQLIGLRALADQHNKILRDIEKAATEILGSEDWVMDYIYESADLDYVLSTLKIKVKD